MSLYELVGGDQWFFDLVDRFYARVEDDPILRPLYPDDLGPPAHHLAQFLVQYWGGPETYSEQRGHPRLRMRHMHMKIGQAERDSWFGHMAAALADGGLSEEAESEVREYFENAAAHLVNEAIPGGPQWTT